MGDALTFDELLAEAELRRRERRAFVPVNFIPRWPRRGVRLEHGCACKMCREVSDEKAAGETG